LQLKGEKKPFVVSYPCSIINAQTHHDREREREGERARVREREGEREGEGCNPTAL
jgi:hypothetical protein